MIPKFRAWDKETSKMCNVGALYFSRDYELEAVSTHLHNDYVASRNLGQVTLMQSTGLKDINGVEIFEGDVVKRARPSKLEDELLAIGFADGSFYSTFIPDWCRTSLFDYVDFGKQVEVIGNIYENPELLNLR